jgi:phosphatidylglycerol:prolipoprotein diacylglycerol transferase
MIPYLEFTKISLGPITLQVWGTLVALGILVGAWTSARYASRLGLDKEIIYRGAFWIIVGALLGARIFHIFAYDFSLYAADPLEMLRVWHGGFSVFGGFIGAVAGYALFARRAKISWLAYADAFIYGLPLGLACGRIGCFLIHDHPGTITQSPLGVRYPDGEVRHDHGLYLSLNGFLLAFVFFLLSKKPRSPAFFCQIFLVWYGIVRFVLDFYRLIDIRYLGLTPAQYGCLAMIVAGAVWAVRDRVRISQAGKP